MRVLEKILKRKNCIVYNFGVTDVKVIFINLTTNEDFLSIWLKIT